MAKNDAPNFREINDCNCWSCIHRVHIRLSIYCCHKYGFKLPDVSSIYVCDGWEE